MTCCFVLGYNTLVDHAVDDRYCFFVGVGRFAFVASVAGVDDVFDFGTHHRAQTHVVLAGFFGLTGALPC